MLKKEGWLLSLIFSKKECKVFFGKLDIKEAQEKGKNNPYECIELNNVRPKIKSTQKF